MTEREYALTVAMCRVATATHMVQRALEVVEELEDKDSIAPLEERLRVTDTLRGWGERLSERIGELEPSNE